MFDEKNILIADDHPAIRRGVKMLLNSEIGSLHFEEASDGKEALNMVRKFSWQLIILDIDLPLLNGYEILEIMKTEHISTPVLVFSLHIHPGVKERVKELGAISFLSKDASTAEIISVVNKILNLK